MANTSEEIVDGFVTQLTRFISEGVRVYVRCGDSGFIVVGVNEFLEASGGMRANSVSGIVSESVVNGDGELVPEGVVNGVRINGVSKAGRGAGRESMVNGLGTNGVGELVPEGVRVNGVSKAGKESVVNSVETKGVGESVLEDVVNGVRTNGQAASRFFGELDKERLLAWFNQEVVDDLGTLREYHSIARGLRVSVRRRRGRIRQLALLRNCQYAAATIRFWERMQLEDVEKGTHAFLMMKEKQTKIDEKASFILNLRRGQTLPVSKLGCVLYRDASAFCLRRLHAFCFKHGLPSSSKSPFTQLPLPLANSSSPADDLIENITSTLALLTQSYRTFLPQTNNQLRTSSNPRNQAIVQDGRVLVQNVQGRPNRGAPDNAFDDDVDEQPIQDLALN
nr:hypothetical protein [Tanacetum cinerariifolium]